ncbi:DinB family protein [Ascidiimonas sp. W6]|uniref:DinB family protein n=1 Tax=Ascidiimonas meishanensis TaxID=3128903 RepID=UPI0030EED53C
MNIIQLKSNEYHLYYQPYFEILGEVDLVEELYSRQDYLFDLLKNIPADKFKYAYEDGKWTIAELLLHIIDTERIFQYRALRFSRNDSTDLSGFEQDQYVANSNAFLRSKKDLIEEFKSVRNSSITLFSAMTDEALLRRGKASGNIISVRALGFLISGHQRHHEQILLERYL